MLKTGSLAVGPVGLKTMPSTPCCAGVASSSRRAMPCAAHGPGHLHRAGRLARFHRRGPPVSSATSSVSRFQHWRWPPPTCLDRGVCSTCCGGCAAGGRRRAQLPFQGRCCRASDLLDRWCLLTLLVVLPGYAVVGRQCLCCDLRAGAVGRLTYWDRRRHAPSCVVLGCRYPLLSSRGLRRSVPASDLLE